jgi:predicted DNA-binding protein (MmcQ/YjbR family)
MRTKAWNTVLLDGSVNQADLREMIDISYDCAMASLPRKYRPGAGTEAPR